MFRGMMRYADFQGRGSRSEFWLHTLFVCIVIVTTFIIDAVVFADTMETDEPLFLFTFIAILALFIPNISAQVRRLHDTNRSGWWYLISMVPFGSIALLVFSVMPGNPGRNNFGPAPLETPNRLRDDGLAYGAAPQYPPQQNPYGHQGGYGQQSAPAYPQQQPGYAPHNAFAPAPQAAPQPTQQQYAPQQPQPQPQAQAQAQRFAPSSPSAPVAAPRPVPAAVAPAGDWMGALEKLAAMKASGILTDAEFAAEKATILAQKNGTIAAASAGVMGFAAASAVPEASSGLPEMNRPSAAQMAKIAGSLGSTLLQVMDDESADEDVSFDDSDEDEFSL